MVTVFPGRWRLFRENRSERYEVAVFRSLHVFVSVVPHCDVRSEEYGHRSRHHRWGHRLSEEVGRLKGGGHVVEYDSSSRDVLACVVKVDVEVLDSALVRVAVAEADACCVVLEDGGWACLGFVQELQDVTQVLCCFDAV